MQRTYHMTGHTIGMTDGDNKIQPSNNHFKSASLSPKVASEIKAKGLRRVAGNIYECPAQRDFWSVRGGKLLRLTMTEVDDGEQLAAAPKQDPGGFLNHVLDELTF